VRPDELRHAQNGIVEDHRSAQDRSHAIHEFRPSYEDGPASPRRSTKAHTRSTVANGHERMSTAHSEGASRTPRTPGRRPEIAIHDDNSRRVRNPNVAYPMSSFAFHAPNFVANPRAETEASRRVRLSRVLCPTF
jgi:hypothetical protein